MRLTGIGASTEPQCAGSAYTTRILEPVFVCFRTLNPQLDPGHMRVATGRCSIRSGGRHADLADRVSNVAIGAASTYVGADRTRVRPAVIQSPAGAERQDYGQLTLGFHDANIPLGLCLKTHTCNS